MQWVTSKISYNGRYKAWDRQRKWTNSKTEDLDWNCSLYSLQAFKKRTTYSPRIHWFANSASVEIVLRSAPCFLPLCLCNCGAFNTPQNTVISLHLLIFFVKWSMLGLERVRKRSAIHTALKSITRIAVTKKSREKNDISYLLLLEMSVLVKSLYNSLNNLGIEWRVTSHTTTKSAFSSLALYFPQHKFAYLVTSWQYSKPFLRSMMRQEHNKSLTIICFCCFSASWWTKKACCVIHLTMLPCFLISSLLLWPRKQPSFVITIYLSMPQMDNGEKRSKQSCQLA